MHAAPMHAAPVRPLPAAPVPMSVASPQPQASPAALSALDVDVLHMLEMLDHEVPVAHHALLADRAPVAAAERPPLTLVR